jgi:DNA-binding MarR family transcriptional regulator
MLADGVIEREPDATDRRRASLRLSRRGLAIYAELVPVAQAYERRLLERLTADELDALDRLMAKLTDRGRELAQD